MKSNRDDRIQVGEAGGDDPLFMQLKHEKEALVTMFLANASITELAAQYKLIDELNSKVKGRGE